MYCVSISVLLAFSRLLSISLCYRKPEFLKSLVCIDRKSKLGKKFVQEWFSWKIPKLKSIYQKISDREHSRETLRPKRHQKISEIWQETRTSPGTKECPKPHLKKKENAICLLLYSKYFLVCCSENFPSTTN